MFRRVLVLLVIGLMGTYPTWSKSPAGNVELKFQLKPLGQFRAKAPLSTASARKRGSRWISGPITLQVRDLSSGIRLRDRHMREDYLEAQQFPVIELKKAIGTEEKFAGILVVRNRSVPIEGNLRVGKESVTAEFNVSISSFGIKSPSYLGVGVEDEVNVTAEIPIAIEMRAPVGKPPAKKKTNKKS